MVVNDTLKILQANVQHWQTNKIMFYNNIRSEDPDIILLNEHAVRENVKKKDMVTKLSGKTKETKPEMELHWQ